MSALPDTGMMVVDGSVAPREMVNVLLDVVSERRLQEDKFPTEDGGFDPEHRLAILAEEVGEIATETLPQSPYARGVHEPLRGELVQVAAVAVRWIECLDAEAGS